MCVHSKMRLESRQFCGVTKIGEKIKGLVHTILCGS